MLISYDVSKRTSVFHCKVSPFSAVRSLHTKMHGIGSLGVLAPSELNGSCHDGRIVYNVEFLKPAGKDFPLRTPPCPSYSLVC